MTTSETTCFVYLQLPGTHRLVTAGKFVLEQEVGRFTYGRSYLENPASVALDQFELPLVRRVFENTRLKGVFGALRDASPDAWGRRVIERFLDRTDLGEVDFLLNSPEDRAGALSFGRSPTPPPPVQRFNQVLQLGQLLAAADLIDSDSPLAPQLDQLLQPGTSMGGARPKNVVEDRHGLWIAKFPARNDRWNNAAVEGAMLQLAQECGLRAASARLTRIGKRDVLLVKRFDREKTDAGYLRHRMVSALTVLRTEESAVDRRGWSYLRFAEELARWSEKPKEDLRELFGRIAFNALISNTDDHPRNHALIAAGEGWRLSPAYDLVPNPLVSAERRDLAMELGPKGRWANRKNLLASAARFRLSAREAKAIVDRTRRIVSERWEETALRAGATRRDCRRIGRAFAYPGFEL